MHNICACTPSETKVTTQGKSTVQITPYVNTPFILFYRDFLAF